MASHNITFDPEAGTPYSANLKSEMNEIKSLLKELVNGH